MGSTDVIARDQVLAELATLGTGTNDAVSLLNQTRDLARFADQVQGELARLAAIVDASGVYAEVGYTSAAAFLRYGCGRSAVRAGELVATGRARSRLQATTQALAEGRVSFDAAHVISRATTQIEDDTLAAAAEQQLLTAATTGGGQPEPSSPANRGSWVPPGLDPRELRRLGEDLTYRADPDAVEERQRKRFERRYLSFGITLDNVGTISGACSDALSIEIIKTAVDAFSPSGGGEDRRTAAQRRMDGRSVPGRTGLRCGRKPPRSDAPSEHPAREAFRARRSRTPRDSGSHAISSRIASPHRARSHAHRPPGPHPGLPGRDLGHPLEGRAAPERRPPLPHRDPRLAPRSDRPGSGLPLARLRTAPSWCTAHHIRPWKLGGATRLPNLVLLCFVHHHYFIHLLGWTLAGTADALLRFIHPGGWLTLGSPLPAQPAGRGP